MRRPIFSDALPLSRNRKARAAREFEILRIAAALGGTDEKTAAQSARHEVLKWVQNRAGRNLPTAAWQHTEFVHHFSGRNCTAVRIADEGSDIWAIRAEDPDKNIPQRVWTTETIVGYCTGQHVRLSVRLLASSPEKELAICPTVPGFVMQLASQCGLYHGSEQLVSNPWLIRSESDVELLIARLIDVHRQIPLFVLTIPDTTRDVEKPLIDPVAIAHATLGIAGVAVLPSEFTWTLTERFGKKLSVFGGAVRAYLPGFGEDANPYGGHELIVADRLSSEQGKLQASTKFHEIAARESLRRLRLGDDVLSYASVRASSADLERARLERQGASSDQRLQAIQDENTNLQTDLARAENDVKWISDEHAKAEDNLKLAKGQLAAARSRIHQLSKQIEEQGKKPDENIPNPEKWSDFADWCETYLHGRVVLSPRARREVKAAQFEDIRSAVRCLSWLANKYYERRLKGGNGDLRGTIESGIRNEPCGADNFTISWQGRQFDVKWHIKSGGNTRSPRRCLRIYYFWDETTQQVVIASMPAHIRTDAT